MKALPVFALVKFGTLASMLGLFSACSSSNRVRLELNQFKDCSEFSDYLQESMVVSQRLLERGGPRVMNESQGSAGPTSAGVALEEGDLAKISGDLLISLQYGKVQIINIQDPSNLSLVKTLDYRGSPREGAQKNPRQILVVREKLYVFSEGGALIDAVGVEGLTYATRSASIDIYDLSAPSIPLRRTIELDGAIDQVRLASDEREIVLLSTDYAGVGSEPKKGSDDSNKFIIPKINRYKPEETEKCKCEEIYYLPPKASGGGVTMAHIHTLSTESFDAKLQQEFSILGESPKLRATDQGYLLALGLNQEVAVTSSDEMTELPAGESKTMIVLSRDQADSINIAGTGFVAGEVLEQFAMEVRGDIVNVFSYHFPAADEMVRAAGPQALSRSPQERTQLTTLKVQDGRLESIQTIDQIGPDEALFSTLFTDGRAYAVTSLVEIFWDPLFAFDLKDFSSPKLVGQLEIDGFSRQLRETPSGAILAIGREAADQTVGGIHISLFSSEATLIDRHIVGTANTFSVAAGSSFWDVGDEGYKSYLYDSEAGLLFLPMSHSNWNFQGRAWSELNHENRVGVYEVRESEIVERPAIVTNHYVSRVLKDPRAYFFINEGQVISRSVTDPSVQLDLLGLPL